VRPLVEAILRHPDLYEGPSMVKPPIVYTAGVLRSLGHRIDTTDWVWLDAISGQLLFYPPNVAGWDDSRWLDTAKFRGRWYVAAYALDRTALDEEAQAGKLPRDERKLLDRALGSVGRTSLEDGTRSLLLEFGRRALADADEDWKRAAYPVLIYNAMRQLILAAPESQTC
jgi:hypothetical protein